MKDRYLILLAFVIIILQSTVLGFLRINEIILNLSLIFLVTISVIFGERKALRFAFYLGILTDILMGKGIGTYVIPYIMISYLIVSIEEIIFKDNLITPVILLVGAGVIFNSYYSVFHYISTGTIISLSKFMNIIIIESLLNVAFGVPIYTIMLKKYIGYAIR